jgi:hypothetical protein
MSEVKIQKYPEITVSSQRYDEEYKLKGTTEEVNSWEYMNKPTLDCPPIPFDIDCKHIKDNLPAVHVNILAHDWKTYAEAWREYALELEHILKGLEK